MTFLDGQYCRLLLCVLNDYIGSVVSFMRTLHPVTVLVEKISAIELSGFVFDATREGQEPGRWVRFNQVKQERWLNRTYSFCMREQINSWLSENYSCLFTIQIWAPAANANNAMRAVIVEIAILAFQHTCNSQRRLLCSSLLWMNNFTHVGLCNKRDSNSGPPVWQMPVFLYFN